MIVFLCVSHWPGANQVVSPRLCREDLHVQPSLGVLPSIPRCSVEIRACLKHLIRAQGLEAVRASRKTAKRGSRDAGMRANGGVWVVVYGAEIAEIRLAALLTRPSIAGCVARAPLVTMG